jgi:menaquinone-dependent protoporphyrinogen oxidase
MSRVLIAYASKMGSTQEIAEVIGATITAAGDEVTVLPAQDVTDIDYYDVVVLGSALYMARWRPDAVRFLRRFRNQLASKALLLFHSGPLGDGADEPQKAPGAVRRLATSIGAQQPTTFPGRIQPETARGFMAKKMAQGPLAGDFRNWDQIRQWAGEIARSMHKEDVHAPHQG